MKQASQAFLASALVLGAANEIYAQYAPPPPPLPFQGFLNEYLRQNDPYMNKWDISGNVRVRYEIKDGFAVQGQAGSADFRGHGAIDNNAYLLTKFRAHAGYTDKWWSAFVEEQTSLAGADLRFAAVAPPAPVAHRGDGPEMDIVTVHQAYVTLGNHKEFPVSLKIGRQEFIYGDERLIGAFGWNNIGRVFDAAKARWQTEWFGADFFVSRPVIPEDTHFNVVNDYDWFSGIYANSAKIPRNILEVYFLARNSSAQALAAEPSPQFPQPSARDIYTPGLRLKSVPGEFGNWDYLLEGAYQFGDFKDPRAGAPAKRLDQQAFMVVAQGGYTFANEWGKPRLALEYSYSSGDGDPKDNKHETFENLFPTNHKFYGYMDLFSLQNIQDLRGIFQLKPCSRVNVSLEGHGFWLANTHDSLYNVAGVARGGTAATPTGAGFGVNPNYSAFVGTELDLITGVAVTRYAQLEAGYGHFFVGDYIKSSLSAPAFGSKDADWVYLQTTINF